MENEDIKLLFEEAQAKLEVSKAASDKYGPQAGITLYEVLLGLDINPVVRFESDRITLAHDGVVFPLWGETIRTINPKALRSPTICPRIRDLVNAAQYCFTRPTPSEKRTHRKEGARDSAIKILRLLGDHDT